MNELTKKYLAAIQDIHVSEPVSLKQLVEALAIASRRAINYHVSIMQKNPPTKLPHSKTDLKEALDEAYKQALTTFVETFKTPEAK